jgi:hypothetical protein
MRLSPFRFAGLNAESAKFRFGSDHRSNITSLHGVVTLCFDALRQRFSCVSPRPRKDNRGVDLITNALPFGRLWY